MTDKTGYVFVATMIISVIAFGIFIGITSFQPPKPEVMITEMTIVRVDFGPRYGSYTTALQSKDGTLAVTYRHYIGAVGDVVRGRYIRYPGGPWQYRLRDQIKGECADD